MVFVASRRSENILRHGYKIPETSRISAAIYWAFEYGDLNSGNIRLKIY